MSLTGEVRRADRAPSPATRGTPADDGAAAMADDAPGRGGRGGRGVGPVSASVALASALALIGFLAAGRILTDNSLLTHLAVGRQILDHGEVPLTDPFSRFGAGESWTVQSWLVATVYAVVDRLGGGGGLRVLHGLVGAAIGVGLWRLTAPARQVLTRFALALAPLLLGIGFWSPRPLLFGLAALVGVLLIVTEDRPGWLLVPLLWLWANAHGSFPLGPVVLALLVVGHLLDARLADGSVAAGARRLATERLRLLGWSLGGVALAAVGPIGPRLVTFPLEVLSRREAMEGVREWAAPSYASRWELLWLVVVLALVPLARRARWATLVPATVFAASGLVAIRNIAPAAIVLVAVLAPACRDLYRTGDPAVASGPGEGRSALRAGAVWRAVTAASLVALVAAVATVAASPGFGLDAYPEEEVDRLEAAGLVAEPDVVLVQRDGVGNYLTWRYGTEARVFMDDRFDFHSLQLVSDHRDLLQGREIRPVLERWHADVVLWEADSALALWLDEADDWDVTLRGERWVVACRVGTAAHARCPH